MVDFSSFFVKMAQPEWKIACCNPFNVRGHTFKRKNLRPVTRWMCEKAPHISIGARICDSCRKKLSRAFIPDVCVESADAHSDSDAEDFLQQRPSLLEGDSAIQPSLFEEHSQPSSASLALVNQCLKESGKTPIRKRKLGTRKYAEKKLDEVTSMMEKLVIGEDSKSEDSEIIQQLKDKFQATSERSIQVQILTVLPQSWSIRKIEKEFGVSNFMARTAKKLVRENGILSTPNPKPSHSIAQTKIDLVVSFYESDESSRLMAGMKDFVSVKQPDGKRVHLQKRLILSNLRELYQSFKENHPTVSVGFSKFAELRPKHCILAGASGTHSVCVCTIHQNVKLMLHALKLPSPFTTYQECLAWLTCNPSTPSCHLRSCSSCPGVDNLETRLMSLLDDNLIDCVVYKQWTSVDRSTLVTVSQPVDEFVESFCSKLEALLTHSFIAKQQSQFYRDMKTSPPPGVFVVSADFSENYAFVLQDAAQGYHWNNAQATVHPFVIYYKDSSSTNHLNFVVVSDCLHHDTIAVYLFQKNLIAFLKKQGSTPTKIIYFSDGAASQYKNRKNFLNLCHHKADFGIEAEWHFSATSHGKSACDGLGGTVKRLAARASLHRPYEHQIMTPFQLYQWAIENIPGVHFCNCSTEEYERQKIFLQTRFEQTRTIPGTRKLHCFIPISKDTLRTRIYSYSTFTGEDRVSKQTRTR